VSFWQNYKVLTHVWNSAQDFTGREAVLSVSVCLSNMSSSLQ